MSRRGISWKNWLNFMEELIKRGEVVEKRWEEWTWTQKKQGVCEWRRKTGKKRSWDTEKSEGQSWRESGNLGKVGCHHGVKCGQCMGRRHCCHLLIGTGGRKETVGKPGSPGWAEEAGGRGKSKKGNLQKKCPAFPSIPNFENLCTNHEDSRWEAKKGRKTEEKENQERRQDAC